MNRVVTTGIAVLGFLGLGLCAVSAEAQEEGKDQVHMLDKSTKVGEIKSEDISGVVITISKADLTLPWKSIKSIDYANAGEFKKAKAYVDSGQVEEAVNALEEFRKNKDVRGILKPHGLNYLGASYLRAGQADKSIEVYNDLFKQYPKTQWLIQGGGENLIYAYLAKGGAKDANTALEALLTTAKSAGVDVMPLNLLRGRVLEALPDFSGAAAAYGQVVNSSADDSTKAAAELGIGRCLAGQKKLAEAEAKYRGLVSKDVPQLVLAGAWNGLGDIALANGMAKNDSEAITVALFDYLRGSVLYTPQAGEPTAEYERAVAGSYRCFKFVSELETKDETRKAAFARRAKDRLDHLQTKFPNSVYLPGK